MRTNGGAIVAAARACSSWKYWYGGKGEKATKALADRLKKENPGVWSASYYKKALKDVDAGAIVCDCSGLVCKAYDIAELGSYSIREKFNKYSGEPLPGMIAWRRGHVGIIIDAAGHMAEMRGIDYDYKENRTWKAAGMTDVLYSPAVDYKNEDSDGGERSTGWHADTRGWWYRHTEGYGPATYYHDGFFIIGRHCYFFNSSGYIEYLEKNSGKWTEKEAPPTDEGGWLA